jgi:hypothetical protein
MGPMRAMGILCVSSGLLGGILLAIRAYFVPGPGIGFEGFVEYIMSGLIVAGWIAGEFLFRVTAERNPDDPLVGPLVGYRVGRWLFRAFGLFFMGSLIWRLHSDALAVSDILGIVGGWAIGIAVVCFSFLAEPQESPDARRAALRRGRETVRTGRARRGPRRHYSRL